MLRANSLRSAVVGSTLMAAIAVAANAVPALAEPTRSRPAGTIAEAVIIPYDMIVPTDKGDEWLSRQKGQFTFDDRFVRNIGYATDWGRGRSSITFKVFRHQGKAVVRTFWFNTEDRPTGFTVAGRGFYKVEVTLCKHRARVPVKCDKETLNRAIAM
jgi:hypothetical protein